MRLEKLGDERNIVIFFAGKVRSIIAIAVSLGHLDPVRAHFFGLVK